MIQIFMLYLSIPSRLNFLQLTRYGLLGEQRFRGQFEFEQGFALLASIKLCQYPGLAVAMLL